MKNKYYLDTCIWIDFLENRIGYNGEPFGNYAFRLLCFIQSTNGKLIISNLLIKELSKKYSLEMINSMFLPFDSSIEKYDLTKERGIEAKQIAKERKLPEEDVKHAILTREFNLILVTRDKHFKDLLDICEFFKPEELF